MIKIHILGGPGSGKTTLGQELSARLHIPHYDLDRENGDEKDSIVIAEQSAWITEGIYLIVTEPMLYHADYIVLLEISWPVAAWRIIKRHIVKSVRGINPYPTKLLPKFLKDTHDYCVNKEAPDSSTAGYTQRYLEHREEATQPPDAEELRARAENYLDIVFAPTAVFVRKYLEQYKQKVIIVRNKAERERLVEMLTNSKV